MYIYIKYKPSIICKKMFQFPAPSLILVYNRRGPHQTAANRRATTVDRQSKGFEGHGSKRINDSRFRSISIQPCRIKYIFVDNLFLSCQVNEGTLILILLVFDWRFKYYWITRNWNLTENKTENLFSVKLMDKRRKKDEPNPTTEYVERSAQLISLRYRSGACWGQHFILRDLFARQNRFFMKTF